MIEVMVSLDNLRHTLARYEPVNHFENRLKGCILPVRLEHGDVVIELEKGVAVNVPHVIRDFDRR